MCFAAAAETASFIAPAETALEPGDVLSVLGPATADETLVEVGFDFAAMLAV